VFIEAKGDGGGGDIRTTGAISRAKLQSNHHHQHSFLQVRSLSCLPTNQPAQHIHQKKHRLRDRTDRAWFSRLLRHLARKLSGSILTTPEPARSAS